MTNEELAEAMAEQFRQLRDHLDLAELSAVDEGPGCRLTDLLDNAEEIITEGLA